MAGVDGPTTGTETGLQDSWWTARVRRGLRDFGKIQADSVPSANGVDGVEAIGAMPYQSTKQPILDGSLIVQDNGAPVTVDATSPPGAGHCYVDLDTGELIFATPPVVGHLIAWKYRYVKWRDQDIIDGLQAGLRAINAAAGKVDQDETLRPIPNRRDYDLPSACADPDARILGLEFRPLDTLIANYEDYPFWKLTALTSIYIVGADTMSPAGRFRLTFRRPYQSLADLEPQLRELPVWYALSVLLPHQEGFRLREDRVAARISDQSNNPGVQLQTGDYYLKRFEAEIKRLQKRPLRGGGGRVMVSTYQMRSAGARAG